ncbi:sulfatase [Tautonia sociabilis]|nr:sulfatase [Tautonia sociabilis]
MKERFLSFLILLVFVSSSAAFFYSARMRRARPFERIIFVTIDTLRRDHLGFYGWPRDTAPFLASLARSGVVFDNAYSAISHTAPSHATIFTSLYPFEHGVLRNHDRLNRKHLTLQAVLQRTGLETVALPAVNFLEGKVGFDQLPTETDHSEAAELSRRYWFRTAEDQVSRAIHWLENGRTQDEFFLWLHFYDPHQWKKIGRLPERYVEQMRDSGNPEQIRAHALRHGSVAEDHFGGAAEFTSVLDNYDARIRYVDDQLRRFYDAVQRMGLGKDTLWVFTSDHGEGLGDHRYEGHGEFLYEEQLQIPLLFHSDRWRGQAVRLHDLIRTVDLLPTLSELAGFDTSLLPSFLRGVSFSQLVIQDEASPEDLPRYSLSQRRPKDDARLRRSWEEGPIYGIQTVDAKLIDHAHAADERYDLRADPGETENLIEAPGPEEEALRSELNSILDGLRDRTSQEEGKAGEALTSDQLEELRSLGYL